MEMVLAEFADERSGILNWLVDGLLDYLENGLVVPAEIQAATNAYRSEMDLVGEFCDACIENLPDNSVAARELFEAYESWCRANSVKPYTERTFAKIMMQKGFRKKMGRIRLYLDVRLKNAPAAGAGSGLDQ